MTPAQMWAYLQENETLIWNFLQSRGLTAPNNDAGVAVVRARDLEKAAWRNYNGAPQSSSVESDAIGAHNNTVRLFRQWSGLGSGTLLGSGGAATAMTASTSTSTGGDSGGGGGKGWLWSLLAIGVAGGTAYATRKHWRKWFKKKK